MSAEATIDLPAPQHFGIVVRDIQKAVEYYTATWGLGPWTFIDNNPTKENMFVGEPFKLTVAMAEWGPVVVELLQPVEGTSVWSEFLHEHGEGLHHICHVVPNFDEVVTQYEERGFKMLAGARFSPTIRWCYFQTTPGGLIQEFLEAGEL